MRRRSPSNLLDLIIQFDGAQTQVLNSLHLLHPSIRLTPHHQWPARVELELVDVTWRGVRHGIGYRFEASDGRVVEAHDSIKAPPYPFDAYRLEQYADAIGVQLASVENVTFSVDDTLAFERCLALLEELGQIRRVERPRSGGLNRYVMT